MACWIPHIYSIYIPPHTNGEWDKAAVDIHIFEIWSEWRNPWMQFQSSFFFKWKMVFFSTCFVGLWPMNKHSHSHECVYVRICTLDSPPTHHNSSFVQRFCFYPTIWSSVGCSCCLFFFVFVCVHGVDKMFKVHLQEKEEKKNKTFIIYIAIISLMLRCFFDRFRSKNPLLHIFQY